MKGRKPSLNPSLFKGLTGAKPSPPQDVEPATRNAQRPTSTAKRRDLVPPIESSSTSESAVPGRRYQRLHLYASEEMLRRVRQMHGEALAANLPMGQRGPSVIMAAALDRFEQLSTEDRLEAIKKRLKP
ncbi:MAG: hypothetical protein M3072_15020 [Candidatus Dormibacteraeota bacterium]|nr:hypothetical protein [Candidatus Dormibacteraeota bacterium]